MLLYSHQPHSSIGGGMVFMGFRSSHSAAAYLIERISDLTDAIDGNQKPRRAVKTKNTAEPRGFYADRHLGELGAPAPNPFAEIRMHPVGQNQEAVNQLAAQLMEQIEAPLMNVDLAIPPAVDWGGDVGGDPPTPPRKKPKRRHTSHPAAHYVTGGQFTLLREELETAQQTPTLESALRVLSLYEAYMANSSTPSILHSLDDRQVIDDTPKKPTLRAAIRTQF